MEPAYGKVFRTVDRVESRWIGLLQVVRGFLAVIHKLFTGWLLSLAEGLRVVNRQNRNKKKAGRRRNFSSEIPLDRHPENPEKFNEPKAQPKAPPNRCGKGCSHEFHAKTTKRITG